MNQNNLILLAPLLFFAFAPGHSFADPTTQPVPDNTQLQQDVQDLRAEVKDLKSRLSSVETTTQPASPAPPKTSPNDIHLAPGWNAGYSLEKGFYVRTEDGNFLFHPWAFVQARDAYNYRSISTSNVHDGQNGLELPRAKFILDGNIFNKDFTFQMIWASSETTGNPGLQDAWGRYHFTGTPFAIEGGNIRNPLDHEQLMFATKTLSSERSLVNNVLLNGDDIVKGGELSIGYDQPGPLRGEIAYTGGQRNFDTTFQNYPTNNASWGVAGRVECKLFGEWDDYNQFTSLSDKQDLLVIGAGADYTEGGATAGLTHVVDAQYNFPNGLSLYAAYLGRYVRNDGAAPTTNGNPATPTATTANTYDATARFTAGYVIARHFEPFLRYEYLHFDAREFTAPTNNDLSEITLGMNYYFYGQRAKATFAASYMPQGSPFTSQMGDVLGTHRGQEVILHTQFQLIF